MTPSLPWSASPLALPLFTGASVTDLKTIALGALIILARLLERVAETHAAGAGFAPRGVM